MPENHWDADKATFKPDFGQAYRDLVAFKAAEDSRRLTLPQKVEDFKAEMPADFKAPQGIEFKIDEADPLMTQYRAFALEQKFDQAQFSKGLGLLAAVRIGEKQQIDNAKAAELTKLGATGTARMTAATTWLEAQLGADLGKEFTRFLFTAKQVEAVEKLMANARTQGQGTFTPQHGEVNPAGKLSDADYQKLSPSERLAYAAKFPQPAHQNGAAR